MKTASVYIDNVLIGTAHDVVTLKTLVYYCEICSKRRKRIDFRFNDTNFVPSDVLIAWRSGMNHPIFDIFGEFE